MHFDPVPLSLLRHFVAQYKSLTIIIIVLYDRVCDLHINYSN